MVEINLYPWREERTRYEAMATKKLWLAGVVVTGMILLIIHVVIGIKLQVVKEEENNLKETLHTFHRDNEQFQQLTAKQPLRVETLNLPVFLILISQFAHQGICLLTIERAKNRIRLSGRAASEIDLTAFLKQWQVSSLFSAIQIDRLNRAKNNSDVEFELQAILKMVDKSEP